MKNVIQDIASDEADGYCADQLENRRGPSMRNYVTAPKKSTSVSLAEPLLAEARALGINVSQAAEEGLAQAVLAKRGEAWVRDNWDAIQDYNRFVEEQGLVLEKYRAF